MDLIGLADNGDAEEVDGVHVEGDGDDVEREGGVGHARHRAGPRQVGGLKTGRCIRLKTRAAGSGIDLFVSPGSGSSHNKIEKMES